MSKNQNDPKTSRVQQVLDERFDDGSWLAILAVFRHTGVADRRQVCQASDLSRDQFNLRLEHFRQLAGDAILAQVPFRVSRPGQRGKPFALFTLGPVGAALLRANGYPKISPCGLKDATPLAHAQAVLDVRLAAEGAGLPVHTERELAYTRSGGQRAVLRPDNLITLPGGMRAIFEVEQVAKLTHLRRVRDSLRHKVAFFLSQTGQKFSNTIRVIVNLPHGSEWDETIAVWERACTIVAEESGGALPFRIRAIPLLAFLAEPDWDEPPGQRRWESLIDPAQLASFAPQADSDAGEPPKAVVKPSRPRKRLPNVPKPWRRRSSADDLLVLEAFWQYFRQNAHQLAGNEDMPPAPSPIFFQIMQLIYVASHDPNTSPWERASFPFASVYLLRRYLQMHPKLRQALAKGVVRGSSSTSWNTHTIRHRMGVIIQRFLEYHGLRLGDTLKARPVGPWDSRKAGFDVQVSLHPELLMGDQDGVVPSRDEVRAAEEALAWVLWALFAHCRRLLSKDPAFW